MIAVATKPDTSQLKEPVAFIEKLLTFQNKPFKLFDFQKDVAKSINLLRDRVCLLKARQVGGTILVAAMLVHAATTNPNATFIVVSKTQEQAGFCYRYSREFFESSPILSRMIDRKKTRKDELVLKNGSRILARTVGMDAATNLRGISCSGNGGLVLDESAYIKSESTETLLHIAHDAGIIHVSTPRRPYGAFYDACLSDSYKTYKIPATLSPRITKDAIEELRKTLRPSQYRTDVLAEFGAGENSVFDSESIEQAIDESIPLFDAGLFQDADWLNQGTCPFKGKENAAYVYSLDVARSSSIDAWVLNIGHYDRQKNRLRISAYAAWAGRRSKHENVIRTDSPTRIISDICSFREIFPCYKFYADATANEFFADHLQNEYLFPVEKVNWSTTKKQLLLEHAATCFRAEKISIPNDPILVQQLIDLAYDVKRMEDESERKIYLAGNDDYVDSLAQLCQVITTEPKYSRIDYLEAW